jgi:hypothetical protein
MTDYAVPADTWKLLASASDNEPLINRAFAAHFRACARMGAIADQPANTSYLCEFQGKEYVVLENVRGVMRVYRVRTDGILKELRRWPKGIW